MQPTFLVIGASKCGTTSLYEVLNRHPEVVMARKKELHFFTKERLYRRGVRWYAEQFPERPGPVRAVGEVTPGYVCYAQASERIRKDLPDARLILLVRDPVRRAWSHYWQARRALVEPLAFDETLDEDLTDVYEPGRRGYFSRGAYARHLEPYLERFPREQLLILPFDDLLREPEAFYRRVFDFIGVDPGFECEATRRNANPSYQWAHALYRFFFDRPRLAARLPLPARRALCTGPRVPFRYPEMQAGTRQTLREFYAEPNRSLSALMGRDLADWTG